MRIKLNLIELIPHKNSCTFWLYIDINNILLIKQLKEKVQRVLKESRDLELCLDNIPFLDEDDIHAINENEEITVIVKEKNNFTESNNFKTDIVELNGAISKNIPITKNSIPFINGNEKLSSIIQSTNSKKRIRKRTHKKNKHQTESIEPIQKECTSFQDDTLISSGESNKIHKRFKLDNENNNQQDSNISESSEEECFEIKREIVRCNSLSSNTKKNSPVLNVERMFTTKFTKVPVFIRGQSSTPINPVKNNSFTENDDNKTIESNTTEDYMLVVDWKNMSPVEVSNISELQIHDVLQFKILSMNECGEPGMSSVITARLEHIYKNTLHIQVLSGIKEFITNNPKFQIDEEENNGIYREIEYGDMFDIIKLV